MSEPLTTHIEFLGVSPWEIEVLYGYFSSRFKVTQQEMAIEEPEYSSILNLNIPFPFSEEFFQWFEFRRWDLIKMLLKEMKRRRGSKNDLFIQISFAGTPDIKFIVDINDRQLYNNAVEKIDFVLELLPYHLDPEKLPKDVSEITYKFDGNASRWRLSKAIVGNKRFEFRDDGWKISI